LLGILAFCFAVPAVLPAQKPVLVYVSDGRIGDLVGCPWGGMCVKSEDLNDFFENRGGRSLFPGWYGSFTRGQMAANGKAWSLGDSSSLRILRGNPDINDAVLALTDQNGALQAAFRIRKDGAEEELRPMFYQPLRPLAEYRSIEFLRAPKNFSFTNVDRYEARYLSEEDLAKGYGVKWGSDFPRIFKAFERKFHLQNPKMFFSDSRFEFVKEVESTRIVMWRKNEEVWFLPEWILSFANSKSTEGAWAPQGDPSRIYYLFLRDDQQVVRILEIRKEAGLSAIYEYTANGLMTVIRPKKRESIAGGDVPFASGVLENLRDTSTEDVPHIHVGLPEAGWGGAPPVTWVGTKPAVDPYAFFFTRGHAFAEWRQRFFDAVTQGGYAFLPDNSWKDARGHKYFVLADPVWSLWKLQAAKPSWYVLEYEPRGSTFALVGITLYDETWNETRLKAPATPSPIEIPPLESWYEENEEEVRSTEYKVGGVVMVGVLALLASFYHRRNR
jgi:hypothetical protein